jgi:hypothetical protein
LELRVFPIRLFLFNQCFLRSDQLVIGGSQLLIDSFEFFGLASGFLLDHPVFFLKPSYRLFIFFGNRCKLVLRHSSTMVHGLPTPLLPLPFNLIPAHGVDSFSRNCVVRFFKCDPQGGDYTEIVSKYTNDWNGRESTKRMEK